MLNKLSRKDIELLNILAQTPEGKSALDEYVEQHEKAVQAYEIYRESVVAEVEVPNVVKSANELRAEVIQRAKEFVEEKDGYGLIWLKLDGKPRRVVDINFVVNDKKRTVVALLKDFLTRKVNSKGIAKCNPDDVFNEHIGKAIALGRALGEDVSEFENAVQPTEPVVGHVVKGNDVLGLYRQDCKFTLTSKRKWYSFYYAENSCNDFIYSGQIGAIINDTNAIYKEVE